MDDLVLVHGFAMPKNIFSDLIAKFSDKFNCINVDLPGDFSPSNLTSINQYAEYIIKQVDKPAIWLGWSLGGLLSLQVAKLKPNLVKKLILVTSSPKFVSTQDWQPAISEQNLLEFYQQIKSNYQKTIKQFLALQTMNMPNQLLTIKCFNQLIAKSPKPDLYSLKQQLQFLLKCDFRLKLVDIRQPTLWLMGDQDMLAPAEAGIKACKLMPNAEVYIIEHCAHLPFFSHLQQFFTKINKWIELN